MSAFFDKLQYHFDEKLPFAIYKKPNDTSVIAYFQQTDELFSINNYTEKGFAFCNFDGTENYIIPENKSDICIEEIILENINSSSNITNFEDENNKNNFEKLVQNGIQSIKKNQFQKVVLSRKETIKLTNFDIITTYKNCINNYTTAFCYCFYHPKIGLWMGATPEQLLQISNNKFTTVALAGTQKNNANKEVIWHKKEIEEQQFVTDFIKENLENLGLNLEISEAFTAQAGNLLHLKSIINGNFNDNFNLKKIIKSLHPTPAVCGLPKENAKKFILKNENYNREFYTGFLGELNINNKTDLFVNLRCMKIENSVTNIFVGCGITKDSIPENEWQETVNKSFTMRKCLV